MGHWGPRTLNQYQPINVGPYPAHEFDPDVIPLIEQYYAQQARESFWAFRQFNDPKMILGWWPQEVSRKLQLFWDMYKAGLRPKLVLMAPPQHGKSRLLQDFIAWITGLDPNLRVIYASYSKDLGVKTNSYLQRVYDSDRYQLAFPLTQISPLAGGERSGRFIRTSSFLEFMEATGSFINTTVEGQVTGKTLDIGLVDDPIKGRDEAQSPQIRNKVWDWLMDDFFSRFDDKAALIITMTRWHVDDPAGRWLSLFPNTIVLRYPVHAEYDEPYRNHGEVLFPEFKSAPFIAERRGSYTAASWQSLYQQNPIVAGGTLFPIEKFIIVPQFSRRDIKKSVRYWDKAGTLGGGAYSSGVLMHEMVDGFYLVEDVVRGQWDYHTREQRIKQTAEIDSTHQRTEVYVEQEPGSGGKESASRTIANLAGFTVQADRITGAKEVRAEPYASQVQGSNVKLLKKRWNREFINEHEAFPAGKYKDQVDSAAGAFAKLITKSYRYDTSMEWARHL